MLLIYVFNGFVLYSPMNEISNGKMVKGCLKEGILFKTYILPKCFAPHNAQLVISNHSYVEVFFWVPTTSTQRSSAVITSSKSCLPILGYINIMASPWPLTFSSGERPRALWALLFQIKWWMMIHSKLAVLILLYM